MARAQYIILIKTTRSPVLYVLQGYVLSEFVYKWPCI